MYGTRYDGPAESHSSASSDDESDSYNMYSMQFNGMPDKCNRCDKKVYLAEKLDIGIILHKKCFRCANCALTLTLNNFVLTKLGDEKKEVYCKAHAPKHVANTMDEQSLGIVAAVNMQKLNRMASFNSQVRNT